MLSGIGLLTRSFFSKYRRYAVVGLLVLAAVITPSGDPFTLMVVFLPIYMLYEVSAFFVKKGCFLKMDGTAIPDEIESNDWSK